LETTTLDGTGPDFFTDSLAAVFFFTTAGFAFFAADIALDAVGFPFALAGSALDKAAFLAAFFLVLLTGLLGGFCRTGADFSFDIFLAVVLVSLGFERAIMMGLFPVQSSHKQMPDKDLSWPKVHP
jgi:hypothetical protein